MPKIKKIHAREVLDSRGNPTVEAVVFTDSAAAGAIAPSGASTGVHEVLELRDNDGKRFNGKGVLKAVENINKLIAKKLVGEDCTKQRHIDNALIELDGTENKSRLGANAILAVSMAVCKTGAVSSKRPLYRHLGDISGNKKLTLPVPQMNIINSGRHAEIENDIQEHMILPVSFKSFSEALRAGIETYHHLKKILKEKHGAKETLLGDEGGFSPHILDIEKRLELMLDAVKEAGYSGKIKLGLDCAASEFFRDNKYNIHGKKFSKYELTDFYKNLIKKFPIVSIEDGMAQDDWEGWGLLNKEMGSKIQLVGDDLLVTNIKRIQMALSHKACNALLLKVSQIGTVTEAIDAANIAIKNRWNVVVSHRSGETEDTFIADLAVGLGASQSKFGAPARGERTAKYNQLLRIEEELGSRAIFSKL